MFCARLSVRFRPRPGSALDHIFVGLTATSQRLMGYQLKIHFTFCHIDSGNFDTDGIAHPIGHPGSLTHERLALLIKLVVVASQRADMDQAFHKNVHQLNKKTKLGDASDNAVMNIANTITHVVALNPLQHFINRRIRTALHQRRMFTQRHYL